jgi:hypothetical protein
MGRKIAEGGVKSVGLIQSQLRYSRYPTNPHDCYSLEVDSESMPVLEKTERIEEGKGMVSSTFHNYARTLKFSPDDSTHTHAHMERSNRHRVHQTAGPPISEREHAAEAARLSMLFSDAVR